MDFIGGIAAGFRGQQDYDLYLRQKAADQQAQQIRQFQIEQAQAQAAQQRRQMSMQPEVDQRTYELMARRQQAPQIPVPPVQAPTPSPGQASVPMQQAPSGAAPEVRSPGQAQPTPSDDPLTRALIDKQRLQRELSMPVQNANPQQVQQRQEILQGEMRKIDAVIAQYSGQQNLQNQPPPGGGMMRTGMSGPQPGGMMPTGGPQGQPQSGPQPLPPYRTMESVGQPQPQGMAQVPPPPVAAQPQQQPRLNSMSMQDAARAIKDMGVTDGSVAMAILERMKPFLNDEAKQEAALLRVQNAQMTNELRNLNFGERVRHDQVTEGQGDRKTTTQEQNAGTAAKRLELAEKKATLAQERLNNPDAKLSDDALDFMADQALAGDKSVYQNLGRGAQGSANITALRARVQEKAKTKGIAGSDLATLNAEFEGLKSGERALGTRTANVSMAVNEASLLSDLALKASDEWKRNGWKSFNDIQKAIDNKTASPEMRKFVAANNSFVNAYARAISPTGVPTVSDKDHAREMLDVGFSKGDYEAVIAQLKLEMEAAQQSPVKSKEELRKLGSSGGGSGGLPSGWSVKVK